MIFTNFRYLLLIFFLLSIVFQYLRYIRIAKNKFRISGILLIKILIRSIIFFLFIIASKALINRNNTNQRINQKVLFVIKTKNSTGFNLTEDDQINIITRVPPTKFNQLEICLFNTSDYQFYQFIPPTSSTTFLHLLKIERPFSRVLQKKAMPQMHSFHQSKRIEVYENLNNQWVLSDTNQEDFNLFEFLNEENAYLSPYLLHYLLILILCLLCLDIGIKYRILKI